MYAKIMLRSCTAMTAKCTQDKSWRVRYNVAQQLYQLCEALGPELARYKLTQLACHHASQHLQAFCKTRTKALVLIAVHMYSSHLLAYCA